jgi:hypothetical protein
MHDERKTTMKEDSSDTFLCIVCKKPVDLRCSKTDEEGKPIHEACSLQSLNHQKSA